MPFSSGDWLLMKLFFVLLLVVSIVYPVYAVFDMLAVTSHNQWEGRQRNLTVMDRGIDSAHLGLSGAELTKLDELDGLAGDAYRRAVEDGFRLGVGHDRLWKTSLGLDALLFMASVGGLLLCRGRGRPLPGRAAD